MSGDKLHEVLAKLIERRAEWEAFQENDVRIGAEKSALHSLGVRDGLEIAIEEVKKSLKSK